MKLFLRLLFVFISIATVYSQIQVKNPVSIVYSEKLKSYICTANNDNYGDDAPCLSAVMNAEIDLIKPGSAGKYLSSAYFNPLGMVIVNDSIFVLDACEVQILTQNGYVKFASNPQTNMQKKLSLRGICYDGMRNLFISSKSEIYQLNMDTKKYRIFSFGNNLNNVYGISWDKNRNKLIIVSHIASSPIQLLNPTDSTLETALQTSIQKAFGITQDAEGNFIVSDWGDAKAGTGKLYFVDKTLQKQPVQMIDGLSGPSFLFYNPLNDTIAVPNKLGNSISFLPSGPPVPIVYNVGDDNKIVSKNPLFRWRKTGSEKYHLQVAQAGMIIEKDDGTILGDDFSTTLIDESNIQDTFYLSNITLQDGKKYIWRVSSITGNKQSQWSKVLSFTPGQINSAEEDIKLDFEVIPNPATDVIEISGFRNLIGIYDVFGQEVISKINLINMNDESNRLRIDISALLQGVYFVKNGNRLIKFIKI